MFNNVHAHRRQKFGSYAESYLRWWWAPLESQLILQKVWTPKSQYDVKLIELLWIELKKLETLSRQGFQSFLVKIPEIAL